MNGQVVLALLVLRPLPFQSLAIYLNWINFPLVKWSDGAERFGYRAGCVRNLYIKTPDGLTLGAWHVLPRRTAPLPAPGAIVNCDELHTHRIADDALRSAERVFLYFHGNAGNRALYHRNITYGLLSAVGARSHVLAIDYRGFADSSPAVPREQTVAIDAMAAFEWLLARGVPPSRIFLVGHSLGSGIATDLAYALSAKAAASPQPQPPFAGLVLLSAYASIRDAAIGYPMVPLLRPFHGWHAGESMIKSLILDHWDSATKMRSIRAPILLIHGKRDFEIQPWQSRALFLEAAGARLGGIRLVEDNGYWQLRRSTSKFSPRELTGISVTELAPGEGHLWSLDTVARNTGADTAPASVTSSTGNATINLPRSPSSTTASPATTQPEPPLWLLEVTHAGHNTLARFQVVLDAIESWVNTSEQATASARPQLQ